LLLDVPAPTHWTRLPGSVSGTRFAGAGSLWPDLFPPSPPPPMAWHCSETSQVLQVCPTSQVRSSSAYVLRLPDASQGNFSLGRTWDLPVSRARCFRTCTGSLTARDSSTPRDIGAPDGAFRFLLQRRRPGVIDLRGSMPGPHIPLSTLRHRPRERLRMTRGRCGSLIHSRMTLSFTTPRRFSRRTGEQR